MFKKKKKKKKPRAAARHVLLLRNVEKFFAAARAVASQQKKIGPGIEPRTWYHGINQVWQNAGEMGKPRHDRHDTKKAEL